MGKKDTLTKEYMADNHIFADAFNYFMFDGGNVIHAEDLRERDSTEMAITYERNQKISPVQKDRDHLKMALVKYDDIATYLLLGIESQSEIHYAMPVKNMVYDALRYTRQVEDTAKANRRSLKEKGMNESDFSEKKMTSGEYLYGFRKRDHLIPVITVVIYFGADEWDAPRSLHEMFDEDSKAFLSLVPDYKLNIIAPANMTNDEINKFRTELREVLLFVKYSKDKAQLAGLLADDEGFKNLDRKTAQLINVLTHSDLKVEESEGDGKVCIAWEGIKADIREAVRPEVREEVWPEVKEEVREEVIAEVREEVRAELIVSLLKSKLLSYEQISDVTRMPVSELKNLELAG